MQTFWTQLRRVLQLTFRGLNLTSRRQRKKPLRCSCSSKTRWGVKDWALQQVSNHLKKPICIRRIGTSSSSRWISKAFPPLTLLIQVVSVLECSEDFLRGLLKSISLRAWEEGLGLAQPRLWVWHNHKFTLEECQAMECNQYMSRIQHSMMKNMNSSQRHSTS